MAAECCEKTIIDLKVESHNYYVRWIFSYYLRCDRVERRLRNNVGPISFRSGVNVTPHGTLPMQTRYFQSYHGHIPPVPLNRQFRHSGMLRVKMNNNGMNGHTIEE